MNSDSKKCMLIKWLDSLIGAVSEINAKIIVIVSYASIFD